MWCKHGEHCVDGSGDYDTIIPEPVVHNLSESGNVVGVKDVYDGSSGCSEEFRMIKPEYIPETGEYYLNMTAPIEGDVLIAGHDNALTWDYFQGNGQTGGPVQNN